MSTVLITVQIPFYHFCTVCCTGDLVLLLDDRKAAYCSLLAGRFTAPGFLGIRQGRRVAVVDPPVAALPPPHDHSQTGWSRGDRRGRAARRGFSGLLLPVLVSLPCLCQERSGAEPQTPPLPPLEGVSSFLPSSSCCCFSTRIEPIHRVSHCLRFLTLATAQSSPAPGPPVLNPGARGCFSQWYFLICLVPPSTVQ